MEFSLGTCATHSSPSGQRTSNVKRHSYGSQVPVFGEQTWMAVLPQSSAFSQGMPSTGVVSKDQEGMTKQSPSGTGSQLPSSAWATSERVALLTVPAAMRLSNSSSLSSSMVPPVWKKVRVGISPESGVITVTQCWQVEYASFGAPARSKLPVVSGGSSGETQLL